MRLFRPIIGLTLVAALSAISMGQGAPATALPTSVDPKTLERGAVDFYTAVGSFKMLGGNGPAVGKLKMSFSGTVLVSGAEKDTKIVTSSGIRLEIDDKKTDKKVYHGTGTLMLDGAARAVQFFGRDLKARFEGNCVIRLYGEFDKKLETGFYKYDGVKEVTAWGTGGMQVVVPSIEQKTPKPRLRLNGKVG